MLPIVGNERQNLIVVHPKYVADGARGVACNVGWANDYPVAQHLPDGPQIAR
jgi:hypothetical protein